MRLCVFSDIHGNGPAFEAAYARICRMQADMHLFLGDLCGYYFDQLAILPLLQGLPNLIAVKGNHDQIFLDILQGNESLRSEYARRYGSSMENLLAADHRELSAWIASLPESFSLCDEKIIGCHGNLENLLNGYVYPDTPVDGVSAPCELLLLGHTHYRMDRVADGCRIVNPGAIGQPRDGETPAFAEIDLDAGRVRFHEVVYDRTGLIKTLISSGESNPYLIEVLDRDRSR